MARKGFRRRLRKGHSAVLRKGSERVNRSASGTRVIFRKDSEGVIRAGRFGRVSGGSFEGWSSRMTLIVGLGINGWDFSVRSDRDEKRSDRPKCLGAMRAIEFKIYGSG